MRASVFTDRRSRDGHVARQGFVLHRIAPALLALLIGGASAAPLATDGPFVRTVAAGGFDEICLHLAAGQQLRYAFKAEAALDFNIHHHRGRDVFYPVRLAALREQTGARFTAPAADDYCLMWENRGLGPVKVEGEIAREPRAAAAR